eukprot:5239659-Prymnesium_polylepis.1
MDHLLARLARSEAATQEGSNPVVPSVRVPPCAHNFGTRDLATAWSGADDPQLSERILSRRCSEGRQAWAASK